MPKDTGERPYWRPQDFLTVEEAETYTRYSARALRQAVARGELEPSGTRRKRLYRRSALDVWLAGDHGPPESRKGPPLPVLVTEAALVAVLMLGVGWRDAPSCELCKHVMHPDVYGAAYARVRIG